MLCSLVPSAFQEPENFDNEMHRYRWMWMCMNESMKSAMMMLLLNSNRFSCSFFASTWVLKKKVNATALSLVLSFL